MKIFAVLSVARQIDGEYVFVKTEKAFKATALAEAYVEQLKKTYADKVVLNTTHGDVPCRCELGVFEIELED
jgi:hypothetical protein